MNKFLLFIGLVLWLCRTEAQLASGAPAPDFTVTDINGQQYSLYSKMGSKGACIAFEATWCGVCWNFHEDGILQNIYNNLSADATAVFLESDFTTNTACLYGNIGCNSSTHGDWVAGSPYQICDLSPSNGPNVSSDYAQTYWPMLYVISPDKRAWEVRTLVYSEFVNWLTKSFKLTTTATTTNCTCGDNGKIVLNVSGGFGTLAYNWSNGANSKDLNNIPGGSYAVTITDANGYYKAFGPWIITNPPKQVDITNAQLTQVKCYNESTGSIEIQTAYGTPPYTYYWSNGKSTKNIDNLKAGTYSITVSDNAACTRVKSYTIIQPAELLLTATSGKEECDEMNGFIAAKVLGGVPPYHYDIGFGAQQTPTFNDLKGGKDYILTITDENGCSKTLKIPIEVSHKPKANAGPTKAFVDCVQESLNLDGSKSSQGTNFTYLWTTADGNIIHGAETLTPEVNKSGKYDLKITDITNKCVDAESMQVTDQRIYPNIKSEGDTTLNCKLIQTTIKGHSDSLPVIYFWKKAYDSLFYKSGKELVTNDSGAFILYVLDSLNACFSKDTVFVKKDTQIPIASVNTPKDVSCKLTEVTIDGSASSQGQNITYQWTTSNGNILSGANAFQALVNKGGEYVLLVHNALNYCEQKASTTVLQQTNITPKITQSITDLSVQFEDQSTGVPKHWLWNFGEPASPNNTSTLKNPLHTYASKGTYQISLFLENDCNNPSVMTSLFVGTLQPIQIIEEIKNPECFGDSTGSIKLNVQGGLPPYTFLWSNQQTSKDIQHLVANNYSVVITDQQGTILNKNFFLYQPDEIDVTAIITNTSAGKQNGSIDITIHGGNPPYKLEWFYGNTSSGNTNLDTGIYYCMITDATGCSKLAGPFTVKEINITANKDLNTIEVDGILAFSVLPNPVTENGVINLKFTAETIYQIDLINILSSTIWSERFQNKGIILPIDFSKFSTGVYFVVLHTMHGKKIVKWIVQ